MHEDFVTWLSPEQFKKLKEQVMKTSDENYEVRIKMKKLMEIADYYEFPIAAFFGPIPKGKRKDTLRKILKDFRKEINLIIDKYMEFLE